MKLKTFIIYYLISNCEDNISINNITLPFTSSEPLSIILSRGSGVESEHLVDIALSDSKGKLIISIGDMDRIVYPRSATKLFQCLALASFNPEVTQKEYSVICSSHNGQKEHVEVVQKFLEKNNLSQKDLICTAHWSLEKNIFIDQVRKYEEPPKLLSNCSGKHSGMLLLSKLLNTDSKGYETLEHPVQKRIIEIINYLSGQNILEFPFGVDGCGVPAFSAPIKVWAKAFASFANSKGLSDELKKGKELISNAIYNEPLLIAGERRICSAIARDLGDKITPKMGAEAVYCCSLNDTGLGLVLKCRDGSRRAVEFALGKIFSLLNYKISKILNKHFDPNIYNLSGKKIGLKEARLNRA